MPYPNEHAARLRDPDDFEVIVQLWDSGEGVRALGGKLKRNGNNMVIQAIRFDAARWTPAAARDWLREHGLRWTVFESARQ